MSRTDKDKPYWILCNDPQQVRHPYHNHNLFGKMTYKNFEGESQYKDYCTIDEPVTKETEFINPCGYRIHWMYYNTKPTKVMRHNEYWRPLRSAERAATHKALREYNATGEIDEDFFLRSAPHRGTYYGGYWD